MEPNKYNRDVEQQNEVELWELLRRIWLYRRDIAAVAVVTLFLGAMVASVLPEEYEATCDMVVQETSSGGLSQMNSLAALAGINLRYNEQVGTLSPYLYEEIIGGVVFGKELLQMTLYSVRDRTYIYLKEYLLNGRRPFPPDDAEYENSYLTDRLTQAEYMCLQELGNRVVLLMDDYTGCLTLSVRMPEKWVAAQVAQRIVTQLQRYITEFKVERVQANLDFVEQRYDEAQRRFERIQAQRAHFRDANRNTSRYAAQIELEKLDAEYTLALNLYNELALQLEQSRISVMERMPVVTIINPVSVPFKRVAPRKMIIIVIFVVGGVLLSVGGVLLLPTLVEITQSRVLRRIVAKRER